MSELQAWRAFSTYFDVAADLAERFRRHDELSAERARTHNPPRPPSAGVLAAREGLTGAEAVERAERAALEYEQARERAAATKQGAIIAMQGVSRWLADHRPELIEIAAERAAELVAEAQSRAAKLERFAPAFDEKKILKNATKAELDAWRWLEGSERPFKAIKQAWVESLRSLCARASTTSGLQELAPFAPGRVGGIHAWRQPENLPEAVADGRDTRLAAVATYADAGGFRLIDVDELKRLAVTRRLERPRRPGRRNAESVFVDVGPLREEPIVSPPDGRRRARVQFIP